MKYLKAFIIYISDNEFFLGALAHKTDEIRHSFKFCSTNESLQNVRNNTDRRREFDRQWFARIKGKKGETEGEKENERMRSPRS